MTPGLPIYSPSAFDDLFPYSRKIVTDAVARAVRRGDEATVRACADAQLMRSPKVPPALRTALRIWMGSKEDSKAALVQRWCEALGATMEAVLTECAISVVHSVPAGVDVAAEVARLLALGADAEMRVDRHTLIQAAIRHGEPDVLKVVLGHLRNLAPGRLPTVDSKDVLDHLVAREKDIEGAAATVAVLGAIYDFSAPDPQNAAKSAFKRLADKKFFNSLDERRLRFVCSFFKNGMLDVSDAKAFLAKRFEYVEFLGPVGKTDRCGPAAVFETLALGSRQPPLPQHEREGIGAPGALRDLAAMGLDLGDPDVTGCNALEAALLYGSPEFVKAMIEVSARKDVTAKELASLANRKDIEPEKIALARAALARCAIQRISHKPVAAIAP